MPVLSGWSHHPVIEYINYSVQRCIFSSAIRVLLQGHLVDLSVVASDGRRLDCHRPVLAALSPFLRTTLEPPDVEQVILPDFSMPEVKSLMNFLYTGRY